ncbi:unnamed protein product [Rhizoctonia solani]|uniref:Tyrosine specific protein phosphatases domain-containing protein n=1 Tax=Rhizoctonia solani TaxID=456999 RepID=A0A8H3DS80_9AGAM|nr:unnamed protein product [Rhizoctonia solani]
MATETQTRKTVSQALASLSLTGSPTPIRSTGSLEKLDKIDSTPTIGTEFGRSVQLSQLLKAENSDTLIRDLAVLISERGVAFFRDQDITIEEQKQLGTRLGELSGKPKSSKLHVHPLTETNAELGDEISIISSDRRASGTRPDFSHLASRGWHADITFEPIPSDYAILKLRELPKFNGSVTGGDTLWASGYEVYDRLSPSFAKYLETLTAAHEAHYFRDAAIAFGYTIREQVRGSPGNFGDALEAVHPVIRTNPVTGWKSVFVNPEFTKRIIGVTRDESDFILNYLFTLIHQNHDLQVRFKWNKNDVAIWDNRSNFHTATYDYEKVLRIGDRVVSLGEKPYFDPRSQSRREYLGSRHEFNLGETTVQQLDQLNTDLEKATTSPIIYGLGTNRNGVYWVTISWATGQRFRTQLGLTPKQFHITLTSVDEHDIDKGPRSVVWVHPSLPIVKTILGYDNLDLTSSSQTEFLASFAYGLLAQNELALAQSAAELLILSDPTNLRSFVCLGDVAIHRSRWKLAMLCFGSALKLHLGDPVNTDFKTDRIAIYCLKQLRRSAEYTDWGTIFTVTDLNDDMASEEFNELPVSSTLRSYLCQPWPISIRQYLQYIYGTSEPGKLPKRVLDSRTRVFTLIPDKTVSPGLPTDNAKDIHPPRVDDIVDLVAGLDVRERTVSRVLGLGSLLQTSTQGHTHAYVRHTLPRFFRWIIPFYMALMSTPRNVDDIAALGSPAIGIRHILTLTEETPLPDIWFRHAATAHIRHTHVPIPNFKPPTLEQMDIILRRIHEPGGSPVLVHCGGGKGRAGTVAACYLAAFGFEPIPSNPLCDATPAMSANEAIATIRLIRPGSIETTHQEEFVKYWVSALWKRNKLLLLRTPEPHATPLLTDGSVSPDVDLLVLCGLPGSGKSWFSQAIVRRGGFLGKDIRGSRSLTPSWRIISQDETGSRSTCENDIGRTGQIGSRAILDRCNPTSEERRLWIKLAPWAQHPVLVWFDYEPQLCIDRAQDRECHPTLLAGPRVRTAITSMKRSFQPPSDWESEGFQGLARITSFEASIELCKLLCPVGLLKFPRTTHILDLGAATSDDVVAEPTLPNFAPIRTDEVVVITEKMDGANMGFSLSPSRELRVQNRSHYINSQDHIQFKSLDSWISSHRESLYAILDRDTTFPERYVLYGEWMAATHSIPYTKLGDLFYAFDLFDRATNTFASRKVLEAALVDTSILLTPIICTDKAIPQSDTLAKLVQLDSRFYSGPVEGIYVKVETESIVRQRGKVVREDFIAGNEHWGKGMVKWNTVPESS